MPFPPEKTKQFAVQFACKTPARKELAAAERKALENVLKGLDPESFQIIHEEQNAVTLFQASRQHHIGPATLTVPSFVLSNGSVTLLSLVMAQSQLINKRRALDTTELNKPMAHVLFEVQNALKGLRYHRAGKIFEIVMGPFMPNEKHRILSKIMACPLEDVGELNLAFAHYRRIDGKIYNFKSVIGFNQLELAHQFDVIMRVDINNRELADSMEPGEIERVWGQADSHVVSYLDEIIGYTP